MVDWGYSINKDSQIDFDLNDKSIYEYVLIKEPSFSVCISCGGCTATCTSGLFADFNIRRLFTLVKRGETKNLKEEIKLCMLCGKCKLACPRGVNTRNIIRILNDKL